MKQRIRKQVQGGLIVLPLLFSSLAFAQSPAVGLSTTLVESPTSAKRWNLPVTYEYASSVHDKNAYERKVQQSLTLVPSYKFSDRYKVSILAAVYRDDSNNEEGGNSAIDNTRLSLTRSQPLTENTTWTQTVGPTFATDQALREETSYQGSLRVGTGLLFNNLPLGSSLTYGLSYTRNFHEYTLSAAGLFNVRETVGNSLDLGVPLVGPLTFRTTLVYSAGHTYRDDLRTKFSAEAGLEWQANKALTVTAGTSNEGNALGPNGTDSNIEFFNDNSSLLKMGLTYIL